MTTEEHEKNRICLSYNPILTICLACMHLNTIGKQISLFRHRGHTVSMALLDLGVEIIASLENMKKVRTIFMDQDFKNRTVLNLITYNGYEPLMRDSKVNVLLDNLWQGESANKCDGRVSDFSKLTYMAITPLMKLKGQKISFSQILGLNFEPHVENESYAQQFKFRKSSIALIFKKNFYSSIIIVLIFTYINIQY